MLCANIVMFCTYCSVHIPLFALHICRFMLCTLVSVHIALCRAVSFHRHTEPQGSEPYVSLGIPRLQALYSVKLTPYSVKLAPYNAKLAF